MLRLDWKGYLFLVALPLCLGCSTDRKPAQLSNRYDAVYKALEDHSLNFEVKNLHTEHKAAKAYGFGSVEYTHRGTIMATGDSDLARESYLLCYTIKRIGGGDPEYPRAKPITYVLIFDGISEFETDGGLKLSTETWSPEQIEMTLVSVYPGIPVKGQVYRN